MTLGHVSNLIRCLSYMISPLKGPDIKFNKTISGWHTTELIGFHSPFSSSLYLRSIPSLSLGALLQLNTGGLFWRSRRRRARSHLIFKGQASSEPIVCEVTMKKKKNVIPGHESVSPAFTSDLNIS